MNNLSGGVFGRLTVMRSCGKDKYRHTLYVCRCECGNMIVVSGNQLTSGHTKSCGCLRTENVSKARLKHGATGDHTNVERLYKIWVGMRQRCNNPCNKAFKYYGRKGVRVCKEWEDYNSFKTWALENGYNADACFGECTIDRINPFGNYEPKNCRWITLTEQAKNKRKSYESISCGHENGGKENENEWTDQK